MSDIPIIDIEVMKAVLSPSSFARLEAQIKIATRAHNAAIEEAAKVAEEARGIEYRHIIAEAIRKLKRAP